MIVWVETETHVNDELVMVIVTFSDKDGNIVNRRINVFRKNDGVEILIDDVWTYDWKLVSDVKTMIGGVL